MSRKTSFVSIIILSAFLFTSNLASPVEQALAYNKPWDQGHDSTNPIDPDDPETPCEPPCDRCKSTGSPVFLKDGNYIYSRNDLFIPGRIPLEITRTYNSKDDKRTGLFGYGWTYNYGLRLVFVEGETDDYVLVLMPSGQRYQFIDNADGTYTPPDGVFLWLVKNPDDTYDFSLKTGTTYSFDTDGNLTSIVDRNGNQISISYTQGFPTTVSDDSGRTFSFTKGTNGKIASIQDPAGRIFAYSYDDAGNLATVTDPLGNVTTYNYDSSHNLLSIIDPKGNTAAAVTYHSDGKVATITHSDGSYTFNYVSSTQTEKIDNNTGATWTYTFNDKGLLAGILDPLGNQTTRTYDERGNLTSETIAGRTTAFTYDDYGNLTSKTGALGNTTTYEYEQTFHQISSITNPLGRVTKLDYDANGNLTRMVLDSGGPLQSEIIFAYNTNGDPIGVTDPMGNTTAFTYDENRNLNQITDPIGNTTKFAYDAVGNKVTGEDPLGNITTYTYDALNRITSVKNPLNGLLTLAFDANGNIASLTDAEGNSVVFSYDSFDRLTSRSDPLNNTTQFTRNANGNLMSMTDANGNTTNYTYDVLGQLIGKSNALGDAINYTYNAVGKPLSVTDANGNVIRFSYDAIDRIVRIEYSGNKFETFTYDAIGNLTSKTDRNGNIVSYSYDTLSRLIAKIYPDATTTNFTYDLNHNLLTAQNADVSYAFTYDALNRLTQIVNQTLSKTVTYSYLYDELRDKLTNPEGGVTTYTYDALKRLTRLVNPYGEVTEYEYDNVSRLIKKTLGNGSYTEYIYDPASRLLSLTNSTSDGSVISSYNYTYDRVSNRVSMTTSSGTHDYAYDNIYQLLQAVHPTTHTENYTYDPVHNRLTSSDYNNWVYDANNKLIGYDGTSYTYDSNGNTISKTNASGTTNYSYDFEDKLTRIDNPDGSYAEYRYDPFGNRIKKDNNGTVTWFVYDLQKELPDVLSEYNQNGDLLLSYTHGKWVDNVISLRRGGTSYYYQKDALNTITSINDAAESIVNTYSYDAFGNVVNKSEGIVNKYGFTGRWYDNESGFLYYRARYYDPSIGRFITSDPIGLEGGINYYAYVLNNPVNRIDPEGLLIWDLIDAGFFVWSFKNFIDCPGWGTGADLALDTISLLPLIPSLGWVTKADDVYDAARLLDRADDVYDAGRASRKAVKEGIYEFIDTTGRKYVGQSGNIPNRLKQHIRLEKLDPGASVKVTEILGGRTTREIAENQRIQELTGGVPARFSDKVSNMRDPIGPNRQHLLK